MAIELDKEPTAMSNESTKQAGQGPIRSGGDGAVGAKAGTDFGKRHLRIGGNVTFMILAATAIVGLIQWGAYQVEAKVDMTSSGINSLSPGTEKLLHGLDQKVRLTSLYFQTDFEENDQPKYRTAVADLLDLFQDTNRSKIEVEHINPLKNVAARRAVFARLFGLERFAAEIEPYRAFVDEFRTERAARIGELLSSELETVAGLMNGLSAGGTAQGDLGQIQALLESWQTELPQVVADVGEAVEATPPRYGVAKSAIVSVYDRLGRNLSAVVDFANQLLSRRPDLSADVSEYLSGVPDRFRPLAEELEAEAAKGRAFKPLEIDSILSQLGDTANAIVVETDTDARVVSFSSVWPVLPQTSGRGGGFASRAFKGEEKITAAILQLTSDQKPAVVLVRFGGPPLFFKGFPGQPMPAPYARMKEVLEDANFAVYEWDVAASETPPTMDPEPTRTIFVLLRPTPPPSNPFAQQNQQPTFGEAHVQKVVDAMGENPRAVVLQGWEPPNPATIMGGTGYSNYLRDEWGIDVTDNELIMRAIPDGPDRFVLRRDSLIVFDFEYGDHVLTSNLPGSALALSLPCPITQAETVPDGVTVTSLLTCPAREGLWAVKSIQPYIERSELGKGVALQEGDRTGPFTVAMVGEKSEGKIVVIGSSSAMEDGWALAAVPTISPEGFSMRLARPGNLALVLNALHYLNDNEEYMDLGRPAGFGTMAVAEGPGLVAMRALVVGVWPGLILCCGLVTWWVRRR